MCLCVPSHLMVPHSIENTVISSKNVLKPGGDLVPQPQQNIKAYKFLQQYTCSSRNVTSCLIFLS